MINCLFSFMSQGSGIALASVVVGAMAPHAYNGAADAGISTWTVAVSSQDGAIRQDTTDMTKAKPGMGMWDPTHPRISGMWDPTHPRI